jgi:proton-coupled amino acid transporter
MKQPILASSARPEEFSSLNPSRFLNQKRPAAFFRDIAFDFANTFKAFIGANYLAAPFAFSKAGWVLGTLILSIIAAISFHCCVLIIGCKRAAIERINARTGEDRMSIASRLQFPDIGREAFGQTGYVVVSAALGLSQAGFCVGYLIFMGITLKVPLFNATSFSLLR